MNPYFFQEECAAAIETAWDDHQSVLSVMATGTGKTRTACMKISEAVARGGRVMILVDQQELVDQWVATIRRTCGIEAQIEQGMNRVSRFYPVRVVVSTFQTQQAGKPPRREKFEPNDYDLLIVDEAHRTATARRLETVNYYRSNTNLRVLALTATADRADGVSLREIAPHVAYRYDIADAIDDGFLVPIRGETVRVPHLDLSVLKTAKGSDYTDEQIATVMSVERVVQETVAGTHQRCQGEPTLLFASTVAHAQVLAEGLAGYAGKDASACVWGDMPRDERKAILDAFRRGDIPYLCSVSVLTTGFDAPVTRNIVMARPTKSRALFCQCIGRGTRVLPGVLDGIGSKEDADRRVEAIAASDKPALNVYSFVGKSASVDLVGPSDVLAGDDIDDEVRVAARAIVNESESSVDPRDAMEEAERRVAEARRLRTEIKSAQVEGQAMDLFGNTGATTGANVGITLGQRQLFQRNKVSDKAMAYLEAHPAEARRLSREIVRRHQAGLATYAQSGHLIRMGYSKSDVRLMSKKRASEILDAAWGKKKVTA